MKLAHDPLLDPVVQQSLEQLHQLQTQRDVARESWDLNRYLDTWTSWILSSSHNQINGLDKFPFRACSAGVSDSIASFVYRHCRKRKIRYSRAEFVGAKIVSNHCGAEHAALEDAAITVNDAVILSFPFAGNGSRHPDHDAVLDTCDRLGVPVFIDMAYFGISHGLQIDLDRPSITDVAISASKFLSTPLRLGVRYRREYVDDTIQSLSDQKVLNRWAADLGEKLLTKYNHDWFVDRYVPLQKNICLEAGIEPTPTFTLALGDESHKDFERGGIYRICITDELHQRLH
jgi:hypothetical protein